MRKALIAISIILLVGCSLAYGKYVYARLAYDFVVLPENSQILYEPGAEDLAKLSAKYLVASLRTVESQQYILFRDVGAIRIFVFNDRSHYANFSRGSVLTRGSSTTNEVYLSEKLREKVDTLASILVHELSHVHVQQRTGTFTYITDLPGWFLEGVAVSVSSGGGAETVTPEQARAAVRNGNRFTPDDAGRIVGHKTAHNYGLEPQMYYRQAGLFVEYLRQSNPEAFRAAFLDVLDGATFRDVWSKYYGRTISELWSSYENSIGIS